MKYYGTIYKGNVGKYDTSSMQSHETAYDALRVADSEWSANPDNQLARLLLVIRTPESGDATQENDRAFFQFKDAASVEAFIDSKCDIIWSSEDYPIGNGNIKTMW